MAELYMVYMAESIYGRAWRSGRIGVALESNGAIIEDTSWLRKGEANSINMAELDVVAEGLNLAIAWGMKRIEIVTDSAIVHQWISYGLTGRRRLKTKAAGKC